MNVEQLISGRLSGGGNEFLRGKSPTGPKENARENAVAVGVRLMAASYVLYVTTV